MVDALFGSTETTAVSNARIASLVQSYLVQEAKLLPLVTDYSSLVGPGAKSIALPRSGGFTVQDKTENTAVSSQIVTYAADAINLTTHKVVQFLAEKFATRQSAPNVLSDMLMKAGKDMAYAVDQLIAAAILAGPSTSNPDHIIDFNDGTNNDVELADFLNIRSLLLAQNIDVSECYVGLNPAKEKDVLGISNFIEAAKWGNSMPIQNGVIGQVYGLKVIISNVFETDSIVAWHPSAVGFAFGQSLVIDEQKDLANLATRYSLDFICGVTGGLDSGKRQVLVEPV
jgi:hypothetical protein